MPDSKYQPNRERKGMALCLSGGGFRAALFHLGALRRLNEVGLLSKITTISSVSGGSIANGLLAKVWPTLTKEGNVFANFSKVYETPLREFCNRDLRTGPLLLDRLDPRNWLTLWSDDHSATDFLAHSYQDHLLEDLRLKDLAAIHTAGGPRFVFDASNLQTGVNFEFSGDRIEKGQVVDLQLGDYQIGYGRAPEMLVADAVAASSAFPIAFPPLVLKFEPGTFNGGDLAKKKVPPADLDVMQRRVVLSDGGVYDNLGLEPVWKSHEFVFCSDGGKPFQTAGDAGSSFLPRLLRCQDVIGNQALAVRKRSLVASLEKAEYRGGYWGIGTEIDGYATHDPHGYPDEVLERLKRVRTDLDAFTEKEQLVLMNHGWLLADAALRTYEDDVLPKSVPAGTYPSETLLNPDRALDALKTSDQVKPFGRG